MLFGERKTKAKKDLTLILGAKGKENKRIESTGWIIPEKNLGFSSNYKIMQNHFFRIVICFWGLKNMSLIAETLIQ